MKTKSCSICSKEFLCRQMIDGKWRNLYLREYCLGCSPYKGGLGKRKDPSRHRCLGKTTEKQCGTCQEWKPLSDFYSTTRGCHGDCKSCTCSKQKDDRLQLKSKAMMHLGGKCVDCKLVDHPCVFDFHHLDQSQKDFQISHHSVKSMTWEEVCVELDKCVLLCSNCHRKRHWS